MWDEKMEKSRILGSFLLPPPATFELQALKLF